MRNAVEYAQVDQGTHVIQTVPGGDADSVSPQRPAAKHEVYEPRRKQLRATGIKLGGGEYPPANRDRTSDPTDDCRTPAAPQSRQLGCQIATYYCQRAGVRPRRRMHGSSDRSRRLESSETRGRWPRSAKRTVLLESTTCPCLISEPISQV